MARFPSLPEQPHLADVFKRFGPSHQSVSPRLAAVLAYLRKLTLTPSRLTDADARAVFEQNVSEQALFDAIAIGALFNFMNRLVEGCGVVTNEANLELSRKRHEAGLDNPAPYREFARRIGVSPEHDSRDA